MRRLQQIRADSGLSAREMIVGATESEVHRALLASYGSNLWRGSEVVRDLIVADIRTALDLGVPERAADLLLVLRLFMTDCPEAALEPCPCEADCPDVRFDEATGRFSIPCPNVVALGKKTPLGT